MKIFEQMIPRRERACRKCGRVFAPGSEVITQLREGERSDRCTSCGPLEGQEWSQWSSTIPLVEEEERQVLCGEERAIAMLREKMESSEGYLLAIYLERLGRLLRYRGKGPLLFEDLETGEMFQVPRTTDADPETARQLIEQLNGPSTEAV